MTSKKLVDAVMALEIAMSGPTMPEMAWTTIIREKMMLSIVTAG
jgi:hypothetical protein